MAKKGERVGTMGDSVYYRTPDGQIIDDNGNVIKGPMAKMMADEYESKQQEKAKAQAEAKAAAEEEKRRKAAEKSAEIARKAAERQQAADAKRQQAQQERDAANAQREAEKQAAAQAREQTAAAKQSAKPPQKTPQPKSQQPRQQAPKEEKAPPAAKEKSFYDLAMNVGQKAFQMSFPTLSRAINTPSATNNKSDEAGFEGGVRQAVNTVADQIGVTNQILLTSVARQEMTNILLHEVIKSSQQMVKEIQKIENKMSGGGILDSILPDAPGAAKNKPGGKVTPKQSMLGRATGFARGLGGAVTGGLLGGGLEAYDEYGESGNLGKAASAGVGGAVGGGLGAWGGASTGAALGAFGGPVGMAIGGLLGAGLGAWGGSWLGGKAGKGAYDYMNTPADAKKVTGASQDVKQAQAFKMDNEVSASLDNVVNLKTLTFNTENLIFNVKNPQPAAEEAKKEETKANESKPNETVAPVIDQKTGAVVKPSTNVVKTSASALPGLRPIQAAVVTGPAKSADIREAISTGQSVATQREPISTGVNLASQQTTLAGSGMAAVQAARAQAGGVPMASGAQSASLGGSNGPGVSDASAVKLAETMVGKNRSQSLDFLRAGGYNNQGEAWCAQFVNSTLKQTGGQGSGSAVANSFQNWGTGVDPSKVQAGDVVLQTRGKGPGQTGGHVGIATGVYQNGQIEMIAGNSSGAVRKYMVPANSSLMVRRGAGGDKQMAAADPSKTDQTVGGTPGAIKPSTGATQANLTPKETSALGAAASATKVSDPTSRKFDAEGKKIEPSTGGMKRMNPETGKFEEIKPGDNSDPYLRKVKSPLADYSSSTQDAIKKAKESAEQASGISGPKTYNVETGQWEPYQLKEQPKYEPAKITEPKQITRGIELNKASTKDIVDERTAKTGITVNQQTNSTAVTDTTKGKLGSDSVGSVEPVDARMRLKELFGMSSVA